MNDIGNTRKRFIVLSSDSSLSLHFFLIHCNGAVIQIGGRANSLHVYWGYYIQGKITNESSIQHYFWKVRIPC